MKTLIIVQARLGSSRLRGKVLKDISGKTMLARVLDRVKKSRLADEVIVATTTNSEDEAIVQECKKLNVNFFRGSEEDVLDRYYQAACHFKADAVVRITSDCPLIDPEVIDRVIETFKKEKPDFASNAIVRTYPRGLDTEIMSLSALHSAWKKAEAPYERTHVTPFIRENSKLFRMVSITSTQNLSRYRWTVDTAEDLEFVRAVYQRFENNNDFDWQDVLDLLDLDPALVKINTDVRQKSLEEC